MALAFLGGLILWLGWFGFNPGSTMAADPLAISHIVITTNIACAAGLVSATIVAWIMLGKPDFSMTVNGALAGLVAITAPCAWVSSISAAIIGLIGGILVVLAVLFFDRIRIDDPVGALSVHLANGIWGTLAVGLFADPAVIASLGLAAGETAPAAGLLLGGGAAQLITQLTGVLAVGGFTFAGAFVVWAAIKYTIGLRVDPHHEIVGLDVSEMGMEAYNGFQVSDPHEHILPIQEPRAATAPPNGMSRFSVMVEGVNTSDLISSWNDLCKPGDGSTPEAFKAIYPFMTTVQGNRFNFRGGDREQIRSSLESLLKDRLKKSLKVYVQ
jgi:Amt family ammonium transporter